MVFNQTVITCIAPPQDPNVIREIKQKNLELHIFAYRPSDNRLSRNSFKFEYMDHVPANITTLSRFNNFHGSAPVCGFCHMEQYNNMTVELSLAKPGVQRRKADDANNEVPEHLKEELQSKSPPREDKSNNAPSCTILHQLATSCTMLHHLAPCCTILHHLALYCTILHYLAQSCTILQNLALSCTMLHHVAPSCTMLRHLAPYCTILHHVAQCCTILRHLAPSCTILHDLAPS